MKAKFSTLLLVILFFTCIETVYAQQPSIAGISDSGATASSDYIIGKMDPDCQFPMQVSGTLSLYGSVATAGDSIQPFTLATSTMEIFLTKLQSNTHYQLTLEIQNATNLPLYTGYDFTTLEATAVSPVMAPPVFSCYQISCSAVVLTGLDGLQANSTVHVYNILGQEKLFVQITQSKQILDVSSFEAGAYIVSIPQERGAITRKIKIIK